MHLACTAFLTHMHTGDRSADAVDAERTIRPVKVAQRAAGGCWRTLLGLADFAIVQSYLSTAAKWGITKIDALRGLFNGNNGRLGERCHRATPRTP